MNSPVLIDTSYWVESFIREDWAAVTGVVLSELLQGARTEREKREIKTLLGAVVWVGTDGRLYARAGEIGFEPRRKGITIPTTDCIVAAAAESIGGSLLTLDGHFEEIDTLDLL